MNLILNSVLIPMVMVLKSLHIWRWIMMAMETLIMLDIFILMPFHKNIIL